MIHFSIDADNIEKLLLKVWCNLTSNLISNYIPIGMHAIQVNFLLTTQYLAHGKSVIVAKKVIVINFGPLSIKLFVYMKFVIPRW